MVAGILWGYRRDKRDELSYDKVKNEKSKLYVGLFLDPIEKVEKHDKKGLIYSSTRQLEQEKKKSKDMTPDRYQQLEDPNDET